MLEEKYKAKVEAMQIYVPLLTKLIAKLEAKNDKSEENVEKMNQLKTLLQQLLDPKPGISFEELNECHEVMENLFKSSKVDGTTKPKTQATQINEVKEKESAEGNKKHANLEVSRVAKVKNDENENLAKAKFETNETESATLKTTTLENGKNDKLKENSNDIATHSLEESLPPGEEKETKNDYIESNKIEHEEYENVELIEFSEEEGDESFENEEMILPDDEEDLLFVDPKEKQANTSERDMESDKENEEKDSDDEQENKKSNEDDKMETEENEEVSMDAMKLKEKSKVAKEKSETEDEDEEIVKINEKSAKNKENKQKKDYEVTIPDSESEKNACKALDEIQPHTLAELNEATDTATENSDVAVDGEHLMDLDSISDAQHAPTNKRTNNLSADTVDETPKTKKVKIWDPIKDIEIETALETVSALANEFLDPLAVDDLNLDECLNENAKEIATDTNADSEENDKTEQIITDKSKIDNTQVDDKKDDKTKVDGNDDDDDDDDVQIIETRNSPILIESDDDDDNKNEKTGSSTPPPKLIISNVKSLSEQAKNNSTTISVPKLTKTVVITKKVNGQTERRVIIKKQTQVATTTTSSQQQQTLQKQTATANALQPKMISGPNPQLFAAKVGNRNLLIPNAFYGTGKKPTGNNVNANPDVAHCRWLENFLRHFCSPYNIAHNTCFLLLQRALRGEDFARVQQLRLELNVTKGEIDEELLRILRGIFYLDKLHQKLSFVGRKFCNLAFVNILDKTISLTVDWRTNGVTSRTRISTATLEAARQQNSSATSTTTAMETSSTVTEPELEFENMQTQETASTAETDTPAVKNQIPAKTTIPPTIIDTFPDDIPATMILTKNHKAPADSVVKKSKVKPSKDLFSVEFITPDDEDNVSIGNKESTSSAQVGVTTRRSQRKASRLANSEITNRFIYDDDDNDNAIDFNDDGADQEFLPVEEDSGSKSSSSVSRGPTASTSNSLPDLGQVDLSAAVKDFAMGKHAASGNADKTGKKNSTFEMAFLERLAHHDKDALIRTKRKATKTGVTIKNQPIVILDDDEDDEEEPAIVPSSSTKTSAGGAAAKLPLEPRLLRQQRIKNIDSEIHFKGKYDGYCLVCKQRVSSIVPHYVNVHPDCEVYISRPTPAFSVLLIKKQMAIAKCDRDRNSLSLFVATCVFCEKRASFTFSYWYQHFASHTGEYAFQCTGCGIRKPSRAHLISHLSNCKKKGELETTHQYDCSLSKITAYMCLLCNYTQMNCANIMRHLICEHGYARVQRDHWTDVTLLEIPKANIQPNVKAGSTKKTIKATQPKGRVTRTRRSNTTDTYVEPSAPAPIIIRDSSGDVFEVAEVDDGKSYAVDLTANVDLPPFVANEAENNNYGGGFYNNQIDEIGDVEGIIQAYINRKN